MTDYDDLRSPIILFSSVHISHMYNGTCLSIGYGQDVRKYARQFDMFDMSDVESIDCPTI